MTCSPLHGETLGGTSDTSDLSYDAASCTSVRSENETWSVSFALRGLGGADKVSSWTPRSTRICGSAVSEAGPSARAASEANEIVIEWLHVDFEPHLLRSYEGCAFRPTEPVS